MWKFKLAQGIFQLSCDKSEIKKTKEKKVMIWIWLNTQELLQGSVNVTYFLRKEQLLLSTIYESTSSNQATRQGRIQTSHDMHFSFVQDETTPRTQTFSSYKLLVLFHTQWFSFKKFTRREEIKPHTSFLSFDKVSIGLDIFLGLSTERFVV